MKIKNLIFYSLVLGYMSLIINTCFFGFEQVVILSNAKLWFSAAGISSVGGFVIMRRLLLEELGELREKAFIIDKGISYIDSVKTELVFRPLTHHEDGKLLIQLEPKDGGGGNHLAFFESDKILPVDPKDVGERCVLEYLPDGRLKVRRIEE